jgi:hypothetical protein
MRGTLNHYAPKIVRDEHAVKNAINEYPQGKVRALPRALRHEVGALRAERFTLMQESPSSAGGALAKADLVTGFGLIARAYSAFRHVVLAADGGPVSASGVNAAARTERNGHRRLVAGLKLLS